MFFSQKFDFDQEEITNFQRSPLLSIYFHFLYSFKTFNFILDISRDSHYFEDLCIKFLKFKNGFCWLDMFSDSIYQIFHLNRMKAHEKLQKRGLLISEIPDLQVYTIKTLLIGWLSIKTVFSCSQKPSY